MLLLFIKALITNFLPEIQFTISTPLSFLTENRENPQNFQKCATAADLAGVTQGNLSLTGNSVTITSPFSNCCPAPLVLGSARLTLENQTMMMTIVIVIIRQPGRDQLLMMTMTLCLCPRKIWWNKICFAIFFLAEDDRIWVWSAWWWQAFSPCWAFHWFPSQSLDIHTVTIGDLGGTFSSSL